MVKIEELDWSERWSFPDKASVFVDVLALAVWYQTLSPPRWPTTAWRGSRRFRRRCDFWWPYQLMQTQRIIDILEVINVYEHHNGCIVVNELLKTLGKSYSIVEFGERINIGIFTVCRSKLLCCFLCIWWVPIVYCFLARRSNRYEVELIAPKPHELLR